MDENNHNNETDTSQNKENPFKSKKFYIAYVATIAIICLASFASGEVLTVLLILSIPFCALSGIVWLFLRKTNRPVALGILFAGITPFTILFIVTGGCGVF